MLCALNLGESSLKVDKANFVTQNGAMSHPTRDFAHFDFGVRKINFFDKTSLARMFNDHEKLQGDSHSISIDKFTKSSIRARS